jgi:TonB family protein
VVLLPALLIGREQNKKVRMMKRKSIAFLLFVLMSGASAFAADEIVCKAKNELRPEYPEMARKLNLSGTARVEVTLTAAGTVSNTKILGGHPVLTTAAVQAIKLAKWEPPTAGNVCVATIRFTNN